VELPADPLLQQRAQAGDGGAQIALGHAYEAEGSHDMARGWFARAAQGGNMEGLRRLAINLLTALPLAIPDGVGMIRQAAENGDAEAAHLCAVLAAQDQHLASNLAVARDYLVRAAQRGHRLAQEQIALLARDGLLALEPWLSHPPLESVREEPRIRVARGFASGAECDWLIARARARLGPAKVYAPDGRGMRAEDMRDNSETVFNIAQSDVVLELLRGRISQATGFATEDMEPATVMHYAVGQRFEPHYDFLDPALPGLKDDIARNGQRMATFLLYLDEGDGGNGGGETEFVDLGWRFRGGKGDALIFFNVEPDGSLDMRTRHAGLPPLSGEKWLLSQWLRRR
jgi:prolyl 4-hydroxylase